MKNIKTILEGNFEKWEWTNNYDDLKNKDNPKNEDSIKHDDELKFRQS